MNKDLVSIARAPQAPANPAPPVVAARRRWWSGRRRPPARLNLALQGGGAHGAFTWGVLDALLEDPRIDVEGISGSSAGAMNAVVLAHGWLQGGRDGARQALADFWAAVGRQLPAAMVSQGGSDGIELSATSKLLLGWAGLFSPAQLNPFDLNPLRELLAGQVDFERLRAASPFKLFVGATQVNSGRLRVFREHELTVDVLLASACLPRLHHAVEVEGQAYWDGGYAANPAVFPLLFDCASSDVLLVLLGPLQREGTPRTLEAIDSRILELGFGANFMPEMHLFAHAERLARPGWLQRGGLDRRLQQQRFHLIDADQLPGLQRTETQALAYRPFLERLHAQGRERAASWLDAHAAGIGRHSTVDLLERFG